MKTKIVGIFVLTLLITTTIPISGQNFTNTKNINEMKTAKNDGWYKTYGGEGIDSFKGLQLTSDGNYILSGETEISDTRDAWLVKVNTNGDLIWETTYGTTNGWDGLWPVIETSDGNYLAGGWFYNNTQKEDDALLIKTDRDGNILWGNTYGGDKKDEFFGLIETADGYLAVGYTFNFSSQNKYGFVVKTDFNGNTIWLKTYEKQDYNVEFDSIVKANENDGFVISGGYASSIYPAQGRIIKIDDEGNLIWDQSYGKLIFHDWCPYINNAPNDTYIVAGGTMGGPLGFFGSNVWLMCLTNDGDVLWEKNYGLPFFKDYSLCVEPTSNGGFIFTGHTLGLGSFGDTYWASSSKMWLVKTDGNGDITWEKKMPGDGHCRTVREINDGFILCGYQGEGHASTSEHAVLIKTDINGEI